MTKRTVLRDSGLRGQQLGQPLQSGYALGPKRARHMQQVALLTGDAQADIQAIGTGQSVSNAGTLAHGSRGSFVDDRRGIACAQR
ncbi:MAG TPA: hypothetical protein DCR55_01550 [Lentisphaeria bacterium]|nr:hypothetical protein [Lentisphaeria bacterium]